MTRSPMWTSCSLIAVGDGVALPVAGAARTRSLDALTRSLRRDGTPEPEGVTEKNIAERQDAIDGR